jgi:DNA repair exonuclease SbcCD ATPase subunit
MNMLVRKIDGQNFRLALISLHYFTSFCIATAIVMASCGCVMTKAQGERLSYKIEMLEDEVAKLQRIRHDIETIFLVQVKDLIDRMARFERQLSTFRQSQADDNNKSNELISEIQRLRAELEETQKNYKQLEFSQDSLAKNQQALKDAQTRIRIPPFKDDHFSEAKKILYG